MTLAARHGSTDASKTVEPLSLNGTKFTPLDLSSGRADAAKMSHRLTIVSLHVEARILLTTVAGRSSMDHVAEGIEHMVIETVLFVAFAIIVGVAVVKAYEWHDDLLYGPYIRAGQLK